ncbi:MAG: hypothetical protein ACREDO_02320, partial [Methyloceanibacter sp.]
MNEKIDKAIKIDSAGSIVGQAVSDYTGQFAFGLVAFGHRKSSNCADSEILAKPGELTTDTEERLLGGIKAKGQA